MVFGLFSFWLTKRNFQEIVLLSCAENVWQLQSKLRNAHTIETLTIYSSDPQFESVYSAYFFVSKYSFISLDFWFIIVDHYHAYCSNDAHIYNYILLNETTTWNEHWNKIRRNDYHYCYYYYWNAPQRQIISW